MQPRRLARFAVLSSSSSEVDIVQSSKRSYTVLSTEYQDYINNHPTNPALNIIFSSFLRRNASLLPRTITPDQAPLSGQAKAKGAPRECPELEHPTPFDAKVLVMTTNGGSAGQEMSEVFSFLSCEHKPAQAL